MNLNSVPAAARQRLSICLALAVVTALAGCDSDRTNRGLNSFSTAQPVMQGNVHAGPVSGATVVAFSVDANGRLGQTIGQGSTTTDSEGFFKLSRNADSFSQDYTGPVVLTATGGTYTSEGDGQTKVLSYTLRGVTVLGVFDPDVELPKVNITILTTLATRLAERGSAGLTEQSLKDASDRIEAIFGDTFDLNATELLDPGTASQGTETQAQQDHTAIVAAFAQLAADLNKTVDEIFDIVVRDIEDGVFDGRDASDTQILDDTGVPVLFARALNNFLNNTTNQRNIQVSTTLQNAVNAFSGVVVTNEISGVDQRTPFVSERFPLPGAVNVPLNSRIFVRFSEDVDSATINANSVVINGGSGTIAGTYSYDSRSKTVVFVPSSLVANDTITVNVNTQVRDLAGNALRQNDSFAFRTGTTSAPNTGFASSLTLSPTSAATVSPNVVAVATFDRPLDPTSVFTPNVFTLKQNGTDVPFRLNYTVGSRSVSVTPLLALDGNTNYRFQIAGSLFDTNGIALGTDRATSFVTGNAGAPDLTRPKVVSTFPEAGALTVGESDSIQVRFDEAMDIASVLGSATLTRDTNGQAIGLDSQYNSSSNTLILTPKTALPASESFTLTIGTNAADTSGNQLASAFVAQFTTAGPALRSLTTSLVDAVVNQPYSAPVRVVGGMPPYTFSLASGSTLPAGMALNVAGNGVISGTAPSTGSTQFTIDVTDSSTPPQRVSQDLTLTVNANVTQATIGFSTDSIVTMNEANQSVTVSVRLVSPTPITNNVTVTVTELSTGTATANVDYTSIGSVDLTFPAQSATGTAVTFNVPVLDDNIFEGNETVQFELSNLQGSGAVLGGATRLTLTITEDDPIPTLSFDQTTARTINEGQSDQFRLTLTNPSTQDVTFNTTVQGTAVNPSDHDLSGGTVTIPAGQTEVLIGFNSNADGFDEDDAETLTLIVDNVSNATLAGGSLTLGDDKSILDIDGFSTVSLSGPTSISESAGTATYTVSLDREHRRSTSNVQVTVSTTAGTADSTDFQSNADILTFLAGETSKTFTVSLLNDSVNEPNEDYTVALSNESLLGLGTSIVTTTITDDDQVPAVQFVSATQTENENVGAAVTLNLELSGPSGFPVTVDYAVDASSTAVNPDDHDLGSGQVTFMPGDVAATITFNIVDDNLTEGSETIVVNLSAPVNSTLGSNATTTLTIADDENAPVATLDITSNGSVVPEANGVVPVSESIGRLGARVTLSNASSSDTQVDVIVGAASTAQQPADNTDLTSTDPLARVYVARNGGTNGATIAAVSPFNSASTFNPEFQIPSLDLQNNEGAIVTTRGELVQAGDVTVNGNIAPSVRVVADIANRAAGVGFDPAQGDKIFVGAATTLVQPKGLDVDSVRERILVADFGGRKVVVFDLAGNAGNVAPIGSIDLSAVTGIAGRPWDLDFDSASNRLFIAMTDGHVLVYDNVFDQLGNVVATSANRAFAVAFDNGSGPQKDSDNLHGIDFDPATGNLYVSDVGSATTSSTAGFNTDGRIYRVLNAAVAGAAPAATQALVLADLRIQTGSGIRLGNPVDIVFDGVNLYVAEKTDDGQDTNGVLIFTNINSATNSGALPPLHKIPFASGEGVESIALDSGRRRDHSLRRVTVHIPAGQTEGSATFVIDNDTRQEATDTVEVLLDSPVGLSFGTSARTVEIQDDDTAPAFSSTTASVTEGEEVLLTLTLDKPAGQTSSLVVNTADMTAVSPADFGAITGRTITFVEGQTYQTLRISTVDDAIDENGTEQFAVNYSSANNLTLTTSSVTIDVDDNDNLPNLIVVGPNAVLEDAGNVSYTVVLSAASGLDVSVDLVLSGATADASLATMSVMIPAGQTSANFDVVVDDDDVNEVSQSYTVTLQNPSASAVLGATTAVTTRIDDNDTLDASFSIIQNGVEGSQDITARVTLNRLSEQDVEFLIAVGGTGVEPVEVGDLTAPASVIIAAGSSEQDFTVSVVADMVNEADESAQIDLTLAQSVSGYVGSTTFSDTTTVEDSDFISVTLTRDSDGDESGTAAEFSVTLSIPTEQTISFTTSYDSGSAGPGDLGTLPTVQFLPRGAIQQTISVPIADDNLNELTETFFIRLSVPAVNNFNAAGSSFVDSASITDNDSISVTLTETQSGAETGNVSMFFQVELSRESSQTIAFTISTQGSGANPASFLTDYDFPVLGSTPSDQVVFTPGQTIRTFELPVNQDNVNEAAEGLETSIARNASYNGFDDGASVFSVQSTITDDDPLVLRIAAQGASGTLSEMGSPEQLFDVNVNRATEQSFTVALTASGSGAFPATLNTDFALLDSTVSFNGSAGSIDVGPKSARVKLTDDNINEPTQTYQVALGAVTGADSSVTVSTVAGESVAQGTILDNNVVTVSLTLGSHGGEANGGTAAPVVFDYALSTVSEQTIDFTLAVVGSGADAAEAGDFTAPPTAFSIVPGTTAGTIEVAVVEDMVNEATESLTATLTLVNAVNNFDQASDLTEQGNIVDDDIATANLVVANSGQVAEDAGQVSVSLELSIPSEQVPEFDVISVELGAGLTATSVAATENTDYVAVSRSIVLNTQQFAILVDITDDANAEQTEDFALLAALTVTPSGIVAGNLTANLSIIDNDIADINIASNGAVAEGSNSEFTVTMSGPRSSVVQVNATLAATSASLPAGSRPVSDPDSATDYDTLQALNALYVVRNDGTATLEGVTLPLSGQTQISSSFEGNQGSVVDSRGRMFIASDVGGAGSIRVIDGIAARGNNAAFDVQVDSIISGSSTLLNLPKGVDIDSRRNLLFVADVGAQKVLVFNSLAVGNIAPVGQIDMTVGPWDIDYVPAQDRLFVAMTNGEVHIFDSFVANYVTAAMPITSGTPTRTLIPTSAGVKASVNIHGIDYNETLDELYISDVGLASDGSDGALFVLRQVGMTNGNIEFAVKIAGAATNLGNPVDIIANGNILYVAEKFNNMVMAYDVSTLPAGLPNQTLNLAPLATITRNRPESLALDNGQRRDLGADRATFAATLEFMPGETSKTFSVATLDDSVFEGAVAESVIAQIATTSMVVNLATSEAIGAVNDNEAQPELSFENTMVQEGNAGSTVNANVVLRLSGLSELDVTVDFTTTELGAANAALVSDNDFVANSGNVTLAAGTVFNSVAVVVNGDDNDEVSEDFNVDFSNAVNAGLNNGTSATVTIQNDDNVPSISIADAAPVTEGNSVFLRYTVTLSAVSGQTVTVEASTTAGTATANSDFTPAMNQVLTFAPGQTSVDFDVAVSEDGLNEDNETVVVSLANPVAAVIATGSATGTIEDNDDVTVSIASATQVEGNGAGNSVDFVVTLSGPSEQAIFVELTSQDGTAVGGTDFATANGQLGTFAPNSTTTTISVAILGDVVAEEDESFDVELVVSPTQGVNRGVTIATGNATGTITDDETITIELGADPAPVSESAGSVNFTVDLSGPAGMTLGRDFVVTVSTAAGTALAGNDYVSTSNQPVNFGSANPAVLSQTVSVNIVDDLVNELDQSFSLNLVSVQGSPARISLGARTSATATITDNDALVIEMRAGTSTTLTEDTGLSLISFGRTTDTEQTITFDVTTQATTPASAASGGANADFTPAVNSLTINASQASDSVQVDIVDDLLDEDDEQFELVLSNLVGQNVSFAQTTYTFTITDNDVEPSLEINIGASTLTVAEEGGDVTVVVSLSAPSGRDVSATIATADGTGIGGAVSTGRPDFNALNSTFTIAAGDLISTQTVVMNGDAINEATETFSIAISSPVNATIGATSSATATVTDNDAIVLDIDNPVLVEGDTGTATMNFTLSLNRDTEQVITVDYQTADRNALNVGPGMGDYEATTGTATFDGQANFGQRQVLVGITVNNDEINETILEEFELRLSNLSIGTFGSSNGVGLAKIQDQDILTVSLSDVTVTETDMDQDVVFTVNFDRLSEQVIIFSVTTDIMGLAGDGAEAGDIANVPMNVTAPGLQPNLPFTLTVVGDNVNEDNEQLNVRIAIVGTPDQVNIAVDTSVLTVLDDDDIRVDIASSLSVPETVGTADFTVAILDAANPATPGQTEQMINVALNTDVSVLTMAPTNAVAATPVEDFDAVVNAMLTFDMATVGNPAAASQIVPVTINDDMPAVNEPDEVFDLVMTAMMLPRGVTLGVDRQSATIIDDDTVVIAVIPPANTTELDLGAMNTATFTIEYRGLSSQDVTLELATEVPALPAPTDPSFATTQAIRDRVTATPGADYVEITEAMPEVRMFPADTVTPLRTMTVDVTVLGDDINEAIQEFLLRVTNSQALPRGILVQPSLAFSGIDDNDDLNFTISVSMTPFQEDMGPVPFMIAAVPTNPATTLTEQTFTIDFQALNGDGMAGTPAFAPTAVAAEAPTDFAITTLPLAISGTATAPATLPLVATPLTQNVNLINDTINEPTEDFRGQISNVAPASTRGVMIAAGMDVATALIVDDDTLVLGFRSRGSVNEGTPASFEIFVDDAPGSGNEATGTTQTITYQLETADIMPPEAVAGSDYVAFGPATLTINGAMTLIAFGPQQVLDTRQVTTNDDVVNEADEDFQATASMLTGELVQFSGMGPPVSITVNQTITDDDVLTFEVVADADYTETDAAGPTRASAFTINVSGSVANPPTNQTFTIPLNFGTVAIDSAEDVHDYDSTSIDSVNFTAGEVEFIGGNLVISGTNATAVTIPSMLVLTLEYVNDDDNEALVESFTLTLGTPAGMPTPANVQLGAQTVATQNINDDDRLDLEITLNPVPFTIAENTATPTVTFFVNRAASTEATATEQTFTLLFATSDGDGGASTPATAGTNDYVQTVQTVDFMGTTGMAVSVNMGDFTVDVGIMNDSINEDNEAFSGRIAFASAITNVQLVSDTASATILDDDDIEIEISTTATMGSPVLESAGVALPFLIEDTVVATTDTEQNWTVDFTTAVPAPMNGQRAATPVDDYIADAATLNFGPGMLSFTRNITVNDDAFNESLETLDGNISNIVPMPTARGVSITTPTVRGFINDDDDLVLRLSVAAASQVEGSTYQFNITPVGAVTLTEQNFTVRFNTQNPAMTSARVTAETADNVPAAGFTADYTPVDNMVAIQTRLVGIATQANNADMQVVSNPDIIHEPNEQFDGNISAPTPAMNEPTLRGVTLQMGSTLVTATINNDDLIVANLGTTVFTPNETDAPANVNVPVELTVGGMPSISEFPLAYNMSIALPAAVPGVVDPAELSDPMLPDDLSVQTMNVNVPDTMMPVVTTFAALQIAVGNSSGNIVIVLTGDDINEADEVFNGTLTTAYGITDASLGATTMANFTIQDDDIVTLTYSDTIAGVALFEQPTAGATMDSLTFTLAGATSTEQEMVIQVTGSGITAMPATPPASALRDYFFIDPLGTNQFVDTLAIQLPVGQTFPLTQTFMVSVPQVISGDEFGPEGARLTTDGNLGGLAPSGTPINNYVVAAGQITQDFTVTDMPVLNVNGAGNLAAPSRTLTYTTGSGFTQLSNGAADLFSTLSYNGVQLTVTLFGETVAGDELNVNPAVTTFAGVGSDVVDIGSGTIIGTVNTNTNMNAALTTPTGGMAQLIVTFNANATDALIENFVSAFRYRDGGKSGLRDLICSFRIDSLPMGTIPENRDVEIDVIGTPAYVNLDDTTAPETVVSLMPTAGDTDRFLVLNNANGNPAIQSTVAPTGDAVARTDNDGNNYNGLTMTVTLMGQTIAFGDAAVLSGGSGMVTVGGGNVSVGGTIVGTITNFGFASPVADDGSGSFVITFNANATEAAVLAIVNDLSYVTSATENDLVTARNAGDVMTVTVVVSDGGPNMVTETITITLP